MGDEKMVSAEEARGCGDGGCVFRAPSDRGQHTNAGCRCLPLRMTPAERVELREQIRSLVVELDETRDRAERAERERDTSRQIVAEQQEAFTQSLGIVQAERDRLARILGDVVGLWREHMDTDAACRFDHHGGCQAHGYLSLEPGERCPVGAALEAADAAREGSDV